MRNSYPQLSHRYYRLKARWFGAEELPFWDRNAPLPDDDDRTIPWPEAERTVLSAYGALLWQRRRRLERDVSRLAGRPPSS